MGIQMGPRGFTGSVRYCSADNGPEKEIDGRREVLIGRNPQRVDIVLDDPIIAGVQCAVRLDERSGLYAVRNLARNPVLLEKELRQENGWSFIPPGSRIAMGRNQKHVFIMGPVTPQPAIPSGPAVIKPAIPSGPAAVDPAGPEAPASLKPEKKKNRKWIPVIAAAIVLCVGIGAFLFSNSPQAQFRKMMDLGAKYLSEMNYEEALLAFKHAWELEPRAEVMERVVDTYVAWTDSMEQEGDLQGASECCLDAWIETTRMGMDGSREDLQEMTLDLAEKMEQEEEGSGIKFMKELGEEDVFTEGEKQNLLQDFLKLLHQKIKELLEAGKIDQAIELQKECLEMMPDPEELSSLAALYDEYEGDEETASTIERYRQKLQQLLDYLEREKEKHGYEEIENYDETIRTIQEKIDSLKEREELLKKKEKVRRFGQTSENRNEMSAAEREAIKEAVANDQNVDPNSENVQMYELEKISFKRPEDKTEWIIDIGSGGDKGNDETQRYYYAINTTDKTIQLIYYEFLVNWTGIPSTESEEARTGPVIPYSVSADTAALDEEKRIVEKTFINYMTKETEGKMITDPVGIIWEGKSSNYNGLNLWHLACVIDDDFYRFLALYDKAGGKMIVQCKEADGQDLRYSSSQMIEIPLAAE